MLDMLQRTIDRNEADAERFKHLPDDTCQLCGAEGPDKRSLRISCFYDVSEVVPEAISLTKVEGTPGWYLRMCKSCRGALLRHLGTWRQEMIERRGTPMDHDGNPEPDDHG